jgi:membrane protein
MCYASAGANGMMKQLSRLLHQIRQWWSARDVATRLLPLYIWRAVDNFGKYGSRRAAALAYFTIFSIFPLSLLLAVTISRVLGAAVAQDQIAQALTLFLPEAQVSQLLLDSISQALEQNVSFTIVALAGLVWSGLGLFSNITSSLDLIFQVPISRSIWRQRLVAVVMILILIVLVTASFLTSGVLQLVSIILVTRHTWIDIAIFFVPLGLNMVIFLLLFRFVPARYVYWDAVWPAAIFGAVGWELAKAGFRWYLENLANYQIVYGSIATVIVLLFWAYLLASIFLFSAELCAQLNEWVTRIHQPDALRLYIQKPPPSLPE